MKYDRHKEALAIKSAIKYYRAIKAYQVLGSIADVLNSMINELGKYATIGSIPSDWYQLAKTLVSDLSLLESTSRENGIVDAEFFTPLSKAWKYASQVKVWGDNQTNIPLSTANAYFANIRNNLTDALSIIIPE